MRKEIKYKKWKICPICGKEFFAKKDCKSRNQIYCSIRCYGISLEGKKPTEKQLEALSKGLGWNKGLKGVSGGWEWPEEAKKRLSERKKGIKLSEEHKGALSIIKKGKPIPHLHNQKVYEKISASEIGKPHPQQRGINHWNWKGGITKLNWQIRSSLAYKEWRRKIFERDNFTCQICGKRGIEIHADHKKPFAKILFDNNIVSLEEALNCRELWDINNGRTLCKNCHLKTITWGGRIFCDNFGKDKNENDIYWKEFTNQKAVKVNG